MGSFEASEREWRPEQSTKEQLDELCDYRTRLVQLARHKLGDAAAAEDIAQETLLRALVHLDDLDAGRSPWPWLKKTASNLVVDHLRRRRREVSLTNEHEPLAPDPSSVEEAHLVRQTLAALPDRQKMALTLRFVDDHAPGEAAKMMDLSRSAYDQLLFRARVGLKAEYRRRSFDASLGVPGAFSALRDIVRAFVERTRDAAWGLSPLGEHLSLAAGSVLAGIVVLVASGSAPTHRPSFTAAGAALQSAPKSPAIDAPRHPHASGRAELRRVPETSASAPRTGRGSASAGSASRADRPTDDLVGRVTGRDVDGPEDAQITSIVISERGGGRTILAAGRASCPLAVCPAVLFRSDDGGATWSRLRAAGFEGRQLLLPPSFGRGDDRIFAIGRSGLQVSPDGGRTFASAGAAGAGRLAGAAAMSPAFDGGDPSILIGAETLVRYRDDLGVVEPLAWATGPGRLYPAFSPQYPADPRVLVGGRVPAVGSGLRSAVHVCSPSTCTAVHVGHASSPPVVRVPADFTRSGLAYAFTPHGVFESIDGAGSFHRVGRQWAARGVRDVAVSADGDVFVAVTEPGGGLYHYEQGRAVWTRIDDPLFQKGASTIALSNERVVVALAPAGVACSDDSGVTWRARCSG